MRANREGFLKFQLRPRRLVDVSRIDMSTDILGVRYDTPIVLAPVGGHRSFHAAGEEAVARAARVGDHLMILSTQSTTAPEVVMAERGAPIWYQLYATNKWDVTRSHLARAERAGCLAVAVTVDRNGGRNQETRFRLERTDTRDCSACHDRSSLESTYQRKPMYEGVDLSGLANIQSSAMTWDTIKRMRDATSMKLLIKGILAHEDAELAVQAGLDGIIVSNHGARSEDSGRSTIDALPEIRRSGARPNADPDRQWFPPRHRYRQGAVHGRHRRLRRPALYLGLGRVRSARGRASSGAVAHRAAHHHAAGWRALDQAARARYGAQDLIDRTNGPDRRIRYLSRTNQAGIKQGLALYSGSCCD